MAYEQRSYSGNAPPTALSAGITASALTISVTDGTGYPTGANGPFFIVIDPATALEEKVLVASRSTNTFTIATITDRGADSTTQQSHGAGAVVHHVHTATDAFEANQSVVHGIARVEAKGDLVAGTGARETGRVVVSATNNDALIVDSAQSTGVRWGKAAPSDHNHSPAQGANLPPTSITGLQPHLDSTAAHGATGAVVGTTNTQTLTNKTLTAPSMTGGTITGAAIGGATLTGATLTGPTITDPAVTSGGMPHPRRLRGTDAQRASFASPQNGDEWWSTDQDRAYFYTTSGWIESWFLPRHSGWVWGGGGAYGPWFIPNGGWNTASGASKTRPVIQGHVYLFSSFWNLYPWAQSGPRNNRVGLLIDNWMIAEQHQVVCHNPGVLASESGALSNAWVATYTGNALFMTCFAADSVNHVAVVNSYWYPYSTIYDLGPAGALA